MFNKISYKKHIILPPAIAALVLLVSMIWVFLSAHNLIMSAQRKVEIADAKFEAVKLLSSLATSENSLRGYLLTGNVLFLETYNEAALHNGMLLDKLRAHQSEVPQIETILNRLEELIKKKFGAGKVALQIQLSAGSYAPHLRMATNDNRVLMDKIRMEISSLERIMENEGDKIDKALAETLNKLKNLAFWIVFIMSMILIINYKRTVWLFEHATTNEERAEKFSHLALHDALTKLPNRRSFEQYLKKAILQANRYQLKVGLLYMDMDGFKLINDQYGHDKGDKALIESVKRISDILRETDFFARVGGDEFVIVANHFTEKVELNVLAQRVINALKAPILIDDRDTQVNMGVSIGVAIYPEHAKSQKLLISKADKAMYAAKSSGKNQAVFVA